MINLDNIYKSYHSGENSVPVLSNLSLTIETGEFVAIMGSSGSGKSTLLNIIGCLDTCDQGSYTLENTSINQASNDKLAQIRSKYIGFVFQSFSLIPRISSQKNIELPMIYAGINSKDRQKKSIKLLEQVGLTDRRHHSSAQLSGGQQQRVAIARALANQPSIIIADEPTGSLDTVSGLEIMDIFTALHKQNKTIVMVTHEDDIANYAQRIIKLRDGVIIEDTSVC